MRLKDKVAFVGAGYIVYRVNHAIGTDKIGSVYKVDDYDK